MTRGGGGSQYTNEWKNGTKNQRDRQPRAGIRKSRRDIGPFKKRLTEGLN